MAMNLKKVAFIDMHARHSTGDDLSLLAAYGASVGSRMAKLGGALGFVGSSQDLTAHFYGQSSGIGTMPHGIIGYAGSTLRAAQMYVEAHPLDNLTVLGRLFRQGIFRCARSLRWWYNEYLPRDETGTRALALRIEYSRPSATPKGSIREIGRYRRELAARAQRVRAVRYIMAKRRSTRTASTSSRTAFARCCSAPAYRSRP